MQKLLRSLMTLLLLCQGLAISIALEKQAYGYVDPGSGFLAFQVGGSMIAGAIFCLRNRIRKFLGLLSKEENPSSGKSIKAVESQR